MAAALVASLLGLTPAVAEERVDPIDPEAETTGTGPDHPAQEHLDADQIEAAMMATPMGNGGAGWLTVTPDVIDANGYTLADATLEITGDCGPVGSVASRQLTRARQYNTLEVTQSVVLSETGPLSGPFSVSEPVYWTETRQLRLIYILDCYYHGQTVRQRLGADVLVAENGVRTTVWYDNDVRVPNTTLKVIDVDTGTEIRTLTNPDSVYDFHLFPGTYLLQYYDAHGDFLTFRAVNVVGYGNYISEHVVLSTPQPGTVSGTVTWSDGSPVANQQIFIAGTDVFGDPFPAEIASTGADGTYAFSDVPAGRHTVQVLHSLYGFVARQDIEVTSNGSHTLDIVLDLDAPAAVAGTATFSDGTIVASDGVGPGNVELVHSGGTTRYAHSDADGRFHFDAVLPGEHQLRATGTYPGGFGDIEYTSDPVTVTAVPTGTVGGDVVIQMPTGIISGAVVSLVDGTPVPDAVVSIPSLGVDEDVTDATGGFLLEGIEGAGTPFRIEVHTLDGDYLGSLLAVLATPGEGTSVTIHVGVPVPVGTVEGSVLWSDGSPAAGAELHITPDGGGGAIPVLLEPDGSYRDFLAPGGHTIEVLIDGVVVASRSVTVVAGDALTVNFNLALPGTVAGEARWADLSGPVAGVEVEITDGTTTLNDISDIDGRFGFDELDPGLWSLTAVHDGETIFAGPVNVPDGGSIAITIDVPLPDGEVDDPGDEPGDDPGDDPGEDPGDDPDPGEDPGDDPGEGPGDDPDPGEDPGSTPPGTEPGDTPPVNEPGDTPPVNEPGDTPPGTGPGDQPGTAPGDEPGATGPGDQPGDRPGASPGDVLSDGGTTGSGTLVRTGPGPNTAALLLAGSFLVLVGLVTLRASHRVSPRTRRAG